MHVAGEGLKTEAPAGEAEASAPHKDQRAGLNSCPVWAMCVRDWIGIETGMGWYGMGWRRRPLLGPWASSINIRLPTIW